MSASTHAAWTTRENRRLQRSFRRELGISLPSTGGENTPKNKTTYCANFEKRMENIRHRGLLRRTLNVLFSKFFK